MRRVKDTVFERTVCVLSILHVSKRTILIHTASGCWQSAQRARERVWLGITLFTVYKENHIAALELEKATSPLYLAVLYK